MTRPCALVFKILNPLGRGVLGALLFTLSAFNYASDTPRPMLAIIIDDIGHSAQQGRALANLSIPLTFAVLPFSAHGADLAELAHAAGKEIMLHAPMSNTQGFPLGPGGLYDSMGEDEFRAQLRANIAAVPHLVGVNNHMGSQLTQNSLAMGWVMRELNAAGLFFIDSRTIASTQAEIEAARHHTPHARRDVFLDHEQTYTHSAAQLNRALNVARTYGHAVAIGHPHASTVRVLRDYAANPAADVDLVLASEIVRVYRPRAKPLSPAPKNSATPRPSITLPAGLPHCPMPAWLHQSWRATPHISDPISLLNTAE